MISYTPTGSHYTVYVINTIRRRLHVHLALQLQRDQLYLAMQICNIISIVHLNKLHIQQNYTSCLHSKGWDPLSSYFNRFYPDICFMSIFCTLQSFYQTILLTQDYFIRNPISWPIRSYYILGAHKQRFKLYQNCSENSFCRWYLTTRTNPCKITSKAHDPS